MFSKRLGLHSVRPTEELTATILTERA